jgi:hypothetical protein
MLVISIKLTYLCRTNTNASVVKLVDTPDLGSGAVRCAGSSPSTRTIKCKLENKCTANVSGLHYFYAHYQIIDDNANSKACFQ